MGIHKLISIICTVFITLPFAISENGPQDTHVAGPDFEKGMRPESKAYGDEVYPAGYFRLPVNREVRLSGTFGELRSNHFHSGIDIKSSNGTVGEPLYAAADGYVSRIKVQAFSYGRALYIDHPNGYTTVYAHLDAFNEELEAYIKKKQYQHQQFSVDLYPDPAAFPLKKGDLIGKLGNSGYSFGPHLHFEIRKTATQVPVNPMLFKLPVKDDIPPRMQQVVVYHLNEKNEVIREKIYPLIRSGSGEYTLSRTLKEPAWRVAFGLKTYDQMDGAYNRNGIYALDLQVDGYSRYGFKMDAIPFHLTRYLNAHIDYRLKKRGKGYINRCYQLPGNQLDIYQPAGKNGIIDLYENKPQEIRITVADAAGNESHLSFLVERKKEVPRPGKATYHFSIPFDTPFQAERNGIRIEMADGTFYENAYLEFTYDPPGHAPGTGTYTIGNPEIPVHKYFDLSIDGSHIAPEDRAKAFIAYIDSRNRVSNFGGTWNGDLIQTRCRSLGRFTIMTDDKAPTVIPASFRRQMQGWKYMSFLIRDNMRTGGDASGLEFYATVDDQWILMEYDGKNDRLTHWFDGSIKPGEHKLKIRVSDDRGNEAHFERTFII